ncbi:MAG: hypothetical protein DRM99_04290 [Thermoplasmata archaeon]|nr:MAG: hypothetical protein DRM99_04290 [Thermoplasmata archaeon]
MVYISKATPGEAVIVHSEAKCITLVDNITFNDEITEYISESVDVRDYNRFVLCVDKSATGSPGNLIVQVQVSPDGESWYDLLSGPFADLRWEATAGDQHEAVSEDCAFCYMRVKVSATGTTATDTFTCSVKLLLKS